MDVFQILFPLNEKKQDPRYSLDADIVTKCVNSAVDPMMAALKMQDDFMKREMARWDTERTRWDARERELTAEIDRLREELRLAYSQGRMVAPLPAAPMPAPVAPVVASVPAPAPIPAVIPEAPKAPVSVPSSFDKLMGNSMAAQSTRHDDEDDEDLLENHGLGLFTTEGGRPPSIIVGYDDIYWMDKLHKALTRAGYYPGDDDIEYWFFGESTQSAVLTFQACNGLPETGCVDETTWRKLIGEDWQSWWDGEAVRLVERPSTPEPLRPVFSFASTDESSFTQPPKSTSEESSPSPSTNLVDNFFKEFASVSNVNASNQPPPPTAAATAAKFPPVDNAAATAAAGDKLPVLREGDGNREVHVLQVYLQKQGYYPGEDDMQWWFFGDDTLTALKTFQACSGLPESGVVDERTWRKLLGDDQLTPAKLQEIAKTNLGDEYDDDMSTAGKDDRVWLIGEQRWEKKSKQ